MVVVVEEEVMGVEAAVEGINHCKSDLDGLRSSSRRSS